MKRGLLDTIADTVRRHGLLRERDRVLVAVSGGADSVALVHALVALDRGGWRIAIGHVNHRLRGAESERDERFVRALAAKLGIAVHVAAASVAKGPNLEERARTARYRALSEIARRERFRRVATAHTLDDQAETVLHRVVRGSGGAGLGGIARIRADGVIRPMLDVERAAVLRFLAVNRLRHRVDRSNASPRFTRNRIRVRLLPALAREINPAVHLALARLADIVRDDEAVLDALAERRARQLVRRGGLDCRRFANQPPALQRRVLRRWLAAERGGLDAIDLGHVEALRELACAGREGEARSLPGGSAAHESGEIRWRASARTSADVRETTVRTPMPLVDGASLPGWRLIVRETTRKTRATPWRGVFDLDCVNGRAIQLRRRLPGDRIEPLGLGGRKKLQDVFVDAKVPRADRASWPVIECDGVILWVPGLARSRHAAVGAATRRFLVVEARREAGSRACEPLRCRKKSVVLPSS